MKKGVQYLATYGCTERKGRRKMKQGRQLTGVLDEICCLFCDLTILRMDGWGTVSALRAIRNNLPVVLTDSYDEESVMEGEHPEMPDFFLSKPYEIKKLGDTIGYVMARRAMIRGK